MAELPTTTSSSVAATASSTKILDPQKQAHIRRINVTNTLWKEKNLEEAIE
jgi:hypothetical protein